jgi:hypothetical protein
MLNFDQISRSLFLFFQFVWSHRALICSTNCRYFHFFEYISKSFENINYSNKVRMNEHEQSLKALLLIVFKIDRISDKFRATSLLKVDRLEFITAWVLCWWVIWRHSKREQVELSLCAILIVYLFPSFFLFCLNKAK